MSGEYVAQGLSSPWRVSGNVCWDSPSLLGPGKPATQGRDPHSVPGSLNGLQGAP